MKITPDNNVKNTKYSREILIRESQMVVVNRELPLAHWGFITSLGRRTILGTQSRVWPKAGLELEEQRAGLESLSKEAAACWSSSAGKVSYFFYNTNTHI